ncbi:unnamed protein product [Nippostrongylus brasiliensis]|uniref:Uncharacterized protein n=1 Tax=Nippostrongylus brasiliensis TaxID=27835 RepID=A0A0N4XUT3_NIPBR|nr:unnamed protein product [Nippostrongylus brasiliensis]
MLEPVRTATSLDSHLPILNPNHSTSSWHTPKRNNSMVSEGRSVSAAIRRVVQQNDAQTGSKTQSEESVAESVKKVELNNNHLPLKKQLSGNTLAKGYERLQ